MIARSRGAQARRLTFGAAGALFHLGCIAGLALSLWQSATWAAAGEEAAPMLALAAAIVCGSGLVGQYLYGWFRRDDLAATLAATEEDLRVVRAERVRLREAVQSRLDHRHARRLAIEVSTDRHGAGDPDATAVDVTAIHTGGPA